MLKILRKPLIPYKLVEFEVDAASQLHTIDASSVCNDVIVFMSVYKCSTTIIFVLHIAKPKPRLIDCQQRFSSISLGSFCRNTTDNNKQQPQQTTQSHTNKQCATTTQQKPNSFRNLCSTVLNNNKVSSVQPLPPNKNEIVANNASSSPSPVPVILCGFMQGDFFGSNFSLPQTTTCDETCDSELYNRAQYLEPRLLASVHDKRGNSVREGRCRFGGLTIGGGGGVGRKRPGCTECGYSCSKLMDTLCSRNCCSRTNSMYSYCDKNRY